MIGMVTSQSALPLFPPVAAQLPGQHADEVAVFFQDVVPGPALFGEQVSFLFVAGEQAVVEEKCDGAVRLVLVARPPVDVVPQRFAALFLRCGDDVEVLPEAFPPPSRAAAFCPGASISPRSAFPCGPGSRNVSAAYRASRENRGR